MRLRLLLPVLIWLGIWGYIGTDATPAPMWFLNLGLAIWLNVVFCILIAKTIWKRRR